MAKHKHPENCNNLDIGRGMYEAVQTQNCSSIKCVGRPESWAPRQVTLTGNLKTAQIDLAKQVTGTSVPTYKTATELFTP